MLKGTILLLLSHLGLVCTMAVTEFIPTNEWQFVPENIAIPGGLEIRMDIENGGRWARKLQNQEGQVSGESDLTVAAAPLATEDLDTLEEKAYDHDDGAEIAQNYGKFLFRTFSNNTDPKSDQAGRIIGICLRNNGDAARAITNECPDLPSTLELNKRSLTILSALVSTKEGLLLVKSHNTLERIRKLVAYSTATQDDDVTKSLTNLLKNLVVAGEDGEQFCQWVDALQEAFYINKNPGIKQLAVDIVKHNGDFETLTVNCPAQPGILPRAEDMKRAEVSAQRFANPKAARNHFEEL